MHIQVIQGQVDDPARMHAVLDQWERRLAPGAAGWLGTTAGVTDDGRFVALARFESAEAAQRNSERPEQGQWWARTAALFSGEVTFEDSDEVTADVDGDPDRAGFVQVAQGRVSDPERAQELLTEAPQEWAAFRPDVIGNVTVADGANRYTMVTYFRSERAAREGERKEPPPLLKARIDELSRLSVGETEYFDLRKPWLYSSR